MSYKQAVQVKDTIMIWHSMSNVLYSQWLSSIRDYGRFNGRYLFEYNFSSTNVRFQTQSVAVFFARGTAVMWKAVLVGFICGGFCVLCSILDFFCVTEYYNRSLEELDEVFLKCVSARKSSSFVCFICTGEINGRTVSKERAVVKDAALVEHDEKEEPKWQRQIYQIEFVFCKIHKYTSIS
ncbi:Plasma membrane low glucose sensor [Sporothrix bragantina]|uniref:Plasma membrane low glucose sensor n=1 Tax=Sporothrix bragantina TaxID=671064 RepID=A0ABP0C9L5_9PEZI